MAARLRETAVFRELDDAHLLELARAGVRRSLPRRARLFRRGAKSDAIALVLSGRLHVVADERTVLRSLGPGHLVGLSTVAGAAHSADIVAAEATEVLVLSGRDVRALFSREPALPLALVVALADLVALLSDELRAERGDDVEARVRAKTRALLAGRREVRITHGELAAMVGAERANVSRALARLEANGELVRKRGRLLAT
jgi:CRP-like cAMP-binding protein